MDDLYQKSRQLFMEIHRRLNFAKAFPEDAGEYIDKAKAALQEFDACQLELMQKQVEFNQQLVLDNIKFGAKI